MLTPITTIELQDLETEDFLRHIDRKIMWKDQTKRDDENLSNGVVINPLKSLSTSHFWIKRNLQILGETGDQCIFVSGCNIVISEFKSDFSKETQRIVQIKTDCTVTSLYTSQSQSGESLIIVGEKTKSADDTNSGRVEIINLDKKILDERRILDHSVYVNYESFIYDAIVPFNSDFCLTILKNTDLTESETKIFIWDYVQISILGIETFEHHIEQIVTNPKNPKQFLFFALYYCAIWNYSTIKKKLICESIYVNDFREVVDACFLNLNMSCVAFKSNKLEIYSSQHKIIKIFNLSEVYFSLQKSVDKIINDSRANENLYNNIYIKENLYMNSNSESNFTELNNNNTGQSIPYNNLNNPIPTNQNNLYNISEENYNNTYSNETITASIPTESKEEKSYPIEEFIKDSVLLTYPNILNIVKIGKLETKNVIKFMICRNNYIFLFFNESNVYYVFEINPENEEKILESGHHFNKSETNENVSINIENNLYNKSKLHNNISIKLIMIEKLNNKVIENSSVLISKNLDTMILVQGEVARSKFMSKFEETKKNILFQSKDKKVNNNIFGKIKDNEKFRHKNEKVKMKYFVYNFKNKGKEEINKNENLIHTNNTNNSPNKNSSRNNIITSENSLQDFPIFTYNTEIFSDSGLGEGVTNIAVSSNPRLILVGYEKKQMNIFLQNNIDEINSPDWNNQNSTINMDNLDALTLSPFNQYSHYLKRMIDTNLILTKNFENNLVTISISPYGNLFFVTFNETSYLYSILDKEIKEIAKINSYCQAATFSKSGNFLAFGNTDNITDKTEYNIIILNLDTFEIEYIISKLPPPVKILWCDNDTKIVVLFHDTSTNILGWVLNEKKFIINQSKDTNKITANKNNLNLSYIDQEQDTNLILKLFDYTEKIIDIAYDDVVDYLLICTEERRVKVIHTSKDDAYWEFQIDCKYFSVLLVKKLDVVIFGTQLGSIRICLWPISNFTGKEQIDHPQFTEKFLHTSPVSSICISQDLKFLYSGGLDGSIFISSILCVNNDTLITQTTFHYFDTKNILPKKTFMNYSDLIYMTDGVYKSKLENIEKRQTDVQIIKSEFISEMDKLMGENSKELDKNRQEMNEEIDKKRKTVKSLEDEKEINTKLLKEKRIGQDKQFRDVLGKIKNRYKTEKENLQLETKNLTGKIKDMRQEFQKEIIKIEQKREDNNTKIKSSLDEISKLLIEKNLQVEQMIKIKTNQFEKELDKVELEYETQIKDKDEKINFDIKNYEDSKNEMSGEISKTKKDNQNYDDKIKEWENHLIELKNNNTDLMESFLFNTLKLKQMSNLLKENEKKISENESEVKKHRTVNDRLEQLRYVLEYQITNLIKEKTPIEEQIKNFEELHNDFYRRFNLLYAEQLNIDEFITNNDQLIENFKDQLIKKKQSLFSLKNLFRAINIGINTIFKDKMDDKNIVMNKLIEIYNRYLKDFVENDDNELQNNQEIKIQSKLIEKEINKQKNKVLAEYVDRRQYRITVNKEKDELMVNIRLQNQQLIEECSSIRMNLEDILKYITDIEKKFIELTNTHLFLNKNQNTKIIRDDIKHAKKSIMLADADKTRVAKGSNTKYENRDKGNLILLLILFI